MDAFFGQVAKAFAGSIGLAPDWTMAVDESAEELAMRTVNAMLEATDKRSISAALWTFRRGTVSSVLEALLQLAAKFSMMPDDAGASASFAEPAVRRWTSDEVRPVLRLLGGTGWVPRTRTGKPDGRWQRASEKLAASLQPGTDVTSLLAQTLGQRALDGGEYYGSSVPAELCVPLTPLLECAREALRERHRARERAFHWLAAHYARRRKEANFASGAYTFGDVAAMVTAAAVNCDDLYFRLGTRYAHVLFDEFQDTSRLQFRFFQPVVEEIGATGGEVLIVGDEKQAIYGWRGGDRELMHAPLADLEKRIGAGEGRVLSESFRSSPAVLDAVNRTFSALRGPWLAEDASDAGVLVAAGREWAAAFPQHRAAERARRLRGRVRLFECTVTNEDGAEEREQLLIQQAVALVGEHLREDPDREIALLLRRNRLMPALIVALRGAHPDLNVSGEGGNPLTDSRAVEIILALLTWLDHPGHSAALHLVQTSALAAAFCFPQGEDGGRSMFAFARDLRRALMERGFAEVLRGWLRHESFARECSDHDRQRLAQLVDVACEFDARGPVRLSEFVAHVRARRVERPGGSRLRVMTVHASKGLEFETIILLDMDSQPGGRGDDFLPDADGTLRLIPSKTDAPLMGLDALVERNTRDGFMDELSVLYVAMTRAKSFLDIVLNAGSKRPSAALLRAALKPDSARVVASHEGSSVRENDSTQGDSTPDEISRDPGIAVSSAGVGKAAPIPEPHTRTVYVTPSGAGEAGVIAISSILSPSDRTAMRRGELIHAWLEQVCWLGEEEPPVEVWVGAALAEADAPPRREIERWAGALHREMHTPGTGLHRVFTRPAAAAGESIELWRERRFAVVREAAGRSELMNGSFDRVHLWRDSKGRAIRAAIHDFKTDAWSTPEERAAIEAKYAPQLESYRSALTLLVPELPAGTITAALVFVSAQGG
jgi:ATP-dependent exoDNAse (exonuclease V) beta subunit